MLDQTRPDAIAWRGIGHRSWPSQAGARYALSAPRWGAGRKVLRMRHRSKGLRLVLLACFAVGCGTAFARDVTPFHEAPDSIESAVYSALIDQHYGRTIHQPVVIDALTIGGGDRFAVDDNLRTLLSVSLSPLTLETISSYESLMERALILGRAPETRPACRLVSQASLDTIFSQCPRGWEILSDRFPGCHGYVTLSNVGRNSMEDEALVYTEDHCGVLCGEGTFVCLRKGDEGWRVERKLTVWVE